MTDPCEEICDALVAYVNALQETNSPFNFAFTAEKPVGIREEMQREQADLKVFFAPYSEEEERVDRGGNALVRASVNMLVIRRLSDGFTRPELADLSWTIRTKLRGVTMASYRWSAVETVVKYDPGELAESVQYAHVSRFTYTRVVGDC